MKKAQLLSLLAKAREQGNHYLIARAALMLQGRGYTSTLTDEEKAEIIHCLERARVRAGMLDLEPGYELARWILICQYLFPEETIRPTTADISMIQEACDSYCNDRILKQVASLVHMGEILNIPINTDQLPPKKRKLVKKLAATLA